MAPGRRGGDGRLHARPDAAAGGAEPGLHHLPLTGVGALLYVPAGYPPDAPLPLVLSLHGAGGNAQHGLSPLRALADEAGFALLAVGAAGRTWDVIVDGYGPDVEAIDEALAHVFGRVPVDPERLAVSGFSDGASYALSLGITNGDLFTHVLAFSPGFMAPAAQHGAPRIFISHGTADRVLPIAGCSRRVVPALQRAGYEVEYREFAGAHTVPPEVAREAVGWFDG
ncbi:MAG: Phospholipase/carboxylesterase [uncultured Gemmatimonadetes bacterium]|uniref:Phospholipase/carboxylesterase n=1 Tax=uncultured Gemmatimonadota bacterium TaxID=203437 RepID=A0A6J4MCR5_9BACT|nr:MAG: Phospholipase/carboxylesterase [uncultured Gemmatimonadota bacterium]